MRTFFLLACAGIIGTLARFLIFSFFSQKVNAIFPWVTFFINMAGAFAIGFLLESFDFFKITSSVRIALVVGVLGSFTTYSTYSWEVISLFREGLWGYGLMYALSTNVVSFILVGTGIVFARFMFCR